MLILTTFQHNDVFHENQRLIQGTILILQCTYDDVNIHIDVYFTMPQRTIFRIDSGNNVCTN
jgi:hypothetical protein